MNTEKNCNTCNNFMQHFMQRNTRFQKLLIGHCKKSFKKGFFSCVEEDCANWEGKDKEIQKKAICETLTQMANQLNEILQILKKEFDSESFKELF